MSEPWWRVLLREQQRSGFRDMAGATGALTIPIADRLVTTVAEMRLLRALPLGGVELRADGRDELTVRVKLKSPSFLPWFTLRFAIVGQPMLPDSPLLTCTILSQGAATVMAPLVRMFATLPPWIRLDHDRVIVNLRFLAGHYGLSDIFAVVTGLRLTTEPGKFVLSIQAALPDDGASAG